MDVYRLISAVNKLQQSLVEIGSEPVQLPQAILVGDQGCGKSSVLEGLIGQRILPNKRSTRRPLIVQFVNSDELDGEEWIEFVHRPNKVFRDFQSVAEEIEFETVRMCGKNESICTIPVFMKFHTNRFMNFTIVDLPGLTRIQVGDQPPCIEAIVKNQTMKYMRYQNSIILAVVSGNTEIQTSEVLQLAKQVDTSGARTLCIITKLDLMDTDMNATKVLQGKMVRGKMGVIGVVCRSQKELDDGVAIDDILKRERSLLELNYSSLANKNGFPYLCCYLHEVIITNLKSSLPAVSERVKDEMESYNESLYPMGKSEIDGQESLLSFLTKFARAYSDSVYGNCKNIGTNELEGGARIGYIFQEVFPRALQSIDPMEGFDEAAILTALRNSSGTKPSLFVPQHCFEQIVKRQISLLNDPSTRCVTLVQEELMRIAYGCKKDICSQMEVFPKLRDKVFEVLGDLVKSRLHETTEMIVNLIKMHSAYINTAHPDFLEEIENYRDILEDLTITKQTGLGNSVPMFSIKYRDTPNETGIILNSFPSECQLILKMVSSYFNIIRKSVADAIPKILMHFMVTYTCDNLLTDLIASIFSNEDPMTYLEESPGVTAQRSKLLAALESLTKTDSVINDFLKI